MDFAGGGHVRGNSKGIILVGWTAKRKRTSAVKLDQKNELEAYARLLADAVRGDPLLFVRQDIVEAAWAICDPILDLPTPPAEYTPGTWGPAEADRLIESAGRRWRPL